jgi:F0F1-type ATP synthase assembly protein I
VRNKNIAWTLAYQILLGMLTPIGIGYVIDSYLTTLPWGVIVGSVIGMIGVFALLLKMIANSK